MAVTNDRRHSGDDRAQDGYQAICLPVRFKRRTLKSWEIPCSTEVMVRVLVVKRLHELSKFQLLDGRSFQRFCGLEHPVNIPDRTTIWNFAQMGGEGIRTIVQSRATFAIGMMVIVYDIRRLAFLAG